MLCGAHFIFMIIIYYTNLLFYYESTCNTNHKYRHKNQSFITTERKKLHSIEAAWNSGVAEPRM
jgi:thiosulfate reductase cytochrome b subunit